MLVKTGFMLKPLEASNAVDGAYKHKVPVVTGTLVTVTVVTLTVVRVTVVRVTVVQGTVVTATVGPLELNS